MFARPRPKKSILPAPTSKKRKVAHAVEEIGFDRDARAEFLTGFHKRKQARIKHAQEVAAERARQDKIEFRKQIREDRRKAVEDHVQTVQKLLREAQEAGQEGFEGELSDADEGDEWDGIPDEAPAAAPLEPPVDHEEEYVDEDRYTTVTVEAVNIDRDGIHKPEPGPEEDDDEEEAAGGQKGGVESPGTGASGKDPKDRPKKKKRKFRYGTKVERQLEQRKQKARRAKR